MGCWTTLKFCEKFGVTRCCSCDCGRGWQLPTADCRDAAREGGSAPSAVGLFSLLVFLIAVPSGGKDSKKQTNENADFFGEHAITSISLFGVCQKVAFF